MNKVGWYFLPCFIPVKHLKAFADLLDVFGPEPIPAQIQVFDDVIQTWNIGFYE